MSYQYINLERHLKTHNQQTITLNFAELEKVLGFTLPASAHKYRPWWANQRDFSGRPQARAWMSAGFEVTSVDLSQKTVSFRRTGVVSPPSTKVMPDKKMAQPVVKQTQRPRNQGTVVLISCVSQKLAHKSPAKDLYTSTLFRLNYAYANKLNPSAIFILSAKYGLVSADDVIDTYDMTLNTMRQQERRCWAQNVISQLREAVDLDKNHFTLLAGERYREHLVPHLPSYEVPLEGLTIGRQLQRLQELVNG